MEPTKRAPFIALEGLNGSGKTTQLDLLKMRAAQDDMTIYFTEEPTHNPIGTIIRDIQTKKLTMLPEITAPLYAADRFDHVTNPEYGILTYLNNHIPVITSRYYLSSYGIQTTMVSMNYVHMANSLARTILKPDITIFLDIDTETALNRAGQVNDPDIFENKKRQEASRRTYYDAIEFLNADGDNIQVIDCSKLNTNEVFDQIWTILLPILTPYMTKKED